MNSLEHTTFVSQWRMQFEALLPWNSIYFIITWDKMSGLNSWAFRSDFQLILKITYFVSLLFMDEDTKALEKGACLRCWGWWSISSTGFKNPDSLGTGWARHGRGPGSAARFPGISSHRRLLIQGERLHSFSWQGCIIFCWGAGREGT